MKRVLSALFAALWLLDTAATISFVATLGAQAEANPLMRLAIQEFGIGGFAGIKAAVLTGWLSVGDRAHVAIHWGLLVLMAPVVYFGSLMAWS